MKNIISGIVLACAAFFLSVAGASETDKTLVSWVWINNTTQQGGSALTIQCGDQFDAIVFGERQIGKWMAGSNFFRRTQKNQDACSLEANDGKTLIQMAIVYEDNEVRIYRNGKRYASYHVKNIDLLSPKSNLVIFGIRHIGASSGDPFNGEIEDARIYAEALTLEEIVLLKPNEKSDIEPYAWWDFEGDKVEDRAGRFAHSATTGDAKLSHGKLVLDGKSSLIAAVTEVAVRMAANGQTPWTTAYDVETPAMPDDVPATWLTYHLAHPGPGAAYPGDPNCAFFYKGRYHLHYIYRNQHGFAFAHVSSRDMVTWKWHPTVLVGPNTGHGMFSGTGFFTKTGQPAIIYHGQGANKNFISLALDENLDEWTVPVPILPKTELGEDVTTRQWDPDCWLNGDTYYAISGGSPPHLIKSSDLRSWASLGLLVHEDMPDLGVSKDEDISCANMFKLGDKWMLLCISHQLGCRYYLGDFQDEKFLPEFHAMMNWKDWEFFAPESLLTPDGRRVMWAWCSLKGGGTQTGIQSLPRELSLPDDGVLRIKPLRELEKLRYDEKNEGHITVESDSSLMLKQLSGDTMELSITIKQTDAKEYGINVFCDEKGNGFAISMLPENKILTLGKIQIPFELHENEDLDLRIFLDKSMIEVFVNDRQAAVAMQPHDKEHVGISLFNVGAAIEADVKGWKMRSIYR